MASDWIRRYSTRDGRLEHVFLKSRLAGAQSYDRIAGYFRSSIFELVGEEIGQIDRVRIVCNSDLDPRDIRASRQAREALLKEKWNETDDEVESLLQRPRYERLYELLKSGRVQVRVVAGPDAPFLHGKAGVIRRADGSATAFIGSLNETREGWSSHYEIVWEDTTAEGVAWVDREFESLWGRSVELPEAIVEEVGRCARKRQVSLAGLEPLEVAAASLVEAPLYRRGEELKPWQRAFVGMFLEHREIYGKARLILADEVGVGKTLSLATSALVSSLLGDGPALILCPATLTRQWQVELKDKLGIPSAVWLSGRKVWQDHNENIIKTRGSEDIARCPYSIGIVSTGLIFQDTADAQFLLNRNYGTLILDEAHRARKARGLTLKEPKANNLYTFMMKAAERAKHIILGTATPIQTHVEELWDLLTILNKGADHVLGRLNSGWRQSATCLPILTGERAVTEELEAWDLLRNPLAPKQEDAIFDMIRSDLGIRRKEFYTDRPVTALEEFTRGELSDRLNEAGVGPGFLRHHNPILRHTVLRKRVTLEQLGLLDKIAVDIWPGESYTGPMFEGLGLRTSAEFEEAYEAARGFTKELRKRQQKVGFMETLVLQRLCSSIAAGVSTAEKLLSKVRLDAEEEDDDQPLLDQMPEIERGEEACLRRLIDALKRKPTDPKLDAVLYFLQERGWAELGSIIFSQFYDTAYWVAENLTATMPSERIAIYAGAGKSGLFLGGEWRSVEREQIKKAVRDRTIRLVVATDAACEGLNLQTLGTLINVDLPWNPSRLEQRIGRIKRFGQTRDRVDMANLVYNNTVDEKVYRALSKRMRDRFDLFGSLPDTIEADWIDDIEKLDEQLSQFTTRKQKANAFDLKYGSTVTPEGEGWERCEKVLARRDVVERLSEGW